ncbi:hypothetical protein ILYODFUR_002491 [Ilyodon furcidens]|uniref:Uncharacterized protein n=1 Tax=Ilyodon furcidens TaxID=33524 RepID=A0ABV0T6Z4_9TELE
MLAFHRSEDLCTNTLPASKNYDAVMFKALRWTGDLSMCLPHLTCSLLEMSTSSTVSQYGRSRCPRRWMKIFSLFFPLLLSSVTPASPRCDPR